MNTPEPSEDLLSAAQLLSCRFDGTQPGVPGVYASLFQFTLDHPDHPGFHPTVYVPDNEKHPVAMLKNKCADAIRKHEQQKRNEL
jgi:hypothetical protein